MANIPCDPIAEQQGVIRRLAEQILDRAGEFLRRGEEGWVRIDESGLGLWVGIRSVRARALFESIYHDISRKNFLPHAEHLNDGFAWARFGY